MSVKDQQKKALLKRYYKELAFINKQRKLYGSEEWSQLYRDKLFQIKQLIRNDLVIIYDYEE